MAINLPSNIQSCCHESSKKNISHTCEADLHLLLNYVKGDAPKTLHTCFRKGKTYF